MAGPWYFRAVIPTDVETFLAQIGEYEVDIKEMKKEKEKKKMRGEG